MKKKLLKPALILIRGIPGSGKSALSALLSEDGKYPVHSVDEYFTDTAGKYQFQFDENHKAYKQCEMMARSSLGKGIIKIFIDNTFSADWEMQPYFKLAAEFKYYLFVITVENRHGNNNVHDISEEQLKKMADKFKVVLLP